MTSMTHNAIITFLAWLCVAAAPTTKPSLDFWLDRARLDLEAARQRPVVRYIPSEIELHLKLLELRGNERDRRLVEQLLPVLEHRITESRDEQSHAAAVAFRAAQLKLLLAHPDAMDAVSDALQKIEALPSTDIFARSDLASTLAFCGKLAEASKILNETPFLARDSFPIQLAARLDAGGHQEMRDQVLAEARQQVLALPKDNHSNKRDFEIRQLARRHAEKGLFQAGLSLVDDINWRPQSRFERARALIDIARQAHEWRKTELAERAVRSAVELNPTSFDVELMRIATDLRMREVFINVVASATRNGLAKLYVTDVARGYAVFGMKREHEQFVREAMRSLLAQRPGDTRRDGILSVGASYAYLGEDVRVTHALALSGLHPDDTLIHTGFVEIVQAYLDADKPFTASALVERWVAPDEREWDYMCIAVTLARLGDVPNAMRVVDRMAFGYRRTRALLAVVRAHLRTGDVLKATDFIDRIDEPLVRADLNLSVARRNPNQDRIFYRVLRD